MIPQRIRSEPFTIRSGHRSAACRFSHFVFVLVHFFQRNQPPDAWIKSKIFLGKDAISARPRTARVINVTLLQASSARHILMPALTRDALPYILSMLVIITLAITAVRSDHANCAQECHAPLTLIVDLKFRSIVPT